LAGFEVVVCGGGIAGIEGVLRLRRLAGDLVRITLLTPDDALLCRPHAVHDPFSLPGARSYPIERIAAETDARWIRAGLAAVDQEARMVRTDRGGELPYDALLLAVGARERSPFAHAHAFTGRNADETLHGIVRGIEQGEVTSVAFVLPRELVWSLPLYELALLTAERAHRIGVEPELTLVAAEGRPLKAFGQAAGDAILHLLTVAGIRLHTGELPSVPGPGLVTFGDARLEADRIVTLPAITGPAIKGVPAGTSWFVPINERCVVEGMGGRVFAAGDATDFPVKHGGLGARQADTAAAGIAHLFGASERPSPFEPVIRGMLLTGGRPLYISARVVGGLGWRSEVHERPPWPAEDKIVAEELGPYLRQLELPPARPLPQRA
jgi:sulfide:quinone oxidoreductase